MKFIRWDGVLAFDANGIMNALLRGRNFFECKTMFPAIASAVFVQNRILFAFKNFEEHGFLGVAIAGAPMCFGVAIECGKFGF